jgi:hemolysin III
MERMQPPTKKTETSMSENAEPKSSAERSLSVGEEIANSISHGFGLILAIVAAPILILEALRLGKAAFVVGVSVFGASMVLLYLASTLYHSISHEKTKHVARLFDHSAIFLLIAGSYTPFTLGVLRGPWGWSLLGIIWGLAAIGLTLKAIGGTRHWWLSMTLYLAMGWLALVAIKPMLALIPLPGIILIMAGGVAYTGGLGFFAANRLRYSHFVWHLFVIAGTTCHFFAVLWYGGGA